MKLTIRAGALATAGLAVLLVAACTPPGQHNGGGKKSGPIKIAIVDAQSGQLSSLGAWEYKGAKLAVSQWNARGGIDGRKIKLDLFDDQGDPTVGANLASKVASGGYLAMIGTAESAVTVAMQPTLQQAKIPSITSGQSTAITKAKSPFQYLNGPTSTTYDETLARYVVDTKGLKNVAMITNNGSFGKGEHDAFLAALTKRGVKPLADEVVTTDQKDFSAALTAIRQKHPQAVFIGSEEVEAGLIVKQARDLGITVPFAGSAPQGTPVFASTAGATNVEGTFVSSPYLSNEVSPAAKAFAAAYQRAYHETAELHGAKAYDGTNIILTALKKSKVAGGQQLTDTIRGNVYKGLLGEFHYDDTGVGIFATTIGVIRGGRVEPVS
jgi:ABC-type branched-subunit amino acid transport system substrate-binding protein